MFNSTILDVAIGLVFVYLLLSLICSAMNETLELFLKQRAANLAKGIRELAGGIADDARARNAAAPAGGVAGPVVPAANSNADGATTDAFLRDFYNHGLINSLYRGTYKDDAKLPSYIPATNFAVAVLDLKETGTKLPPNIQTALTAFDRLSRGDREKLQKYIEDWYNSAMDRISGWYKRRSQLIVLVFGLGLAVLVNADTVQIAKRLSTDTHLRESAVRMAEGKAKEAAPETGSTHGSEVDQIRDNLQKMDGVGLPVGWDRWPGWGDVAPLAKMHGVGWLLTALAISLGAPFWFDVLNKFIVIRGTVKPSEKSGDEGSKDSRPKAPTAPNADGDPTVNPK